MSDLAPLGRPGELVPAGSPTDPWDRWLGQYKSSETRSAYRRDLGQWLDWMLTCDRAPLEATPGDVNGWIAQLRQFGLAESSIARKVSAVGSYFTWAREEGLTTANPMPARRPTADQSAGPTLGLDRDVAQRVLAVAGRQDPRTRALVTLLAYTGMRVSEATGLDVGDLQEERGHRVLRVTGKGNKRRNVPASASVVAALRDYIGDRTDGPIFVTKTGARLDRREAYRIIVRVGDHAGVKLHPHLFRHTAATLALDAGAPVDRVQRWLGHASLDTTMGYVRGRENLDASPAHDLARFLAQD
jgi:integrase/recombinase XerD